jgi:hypothetical protein
MKLSAAVADFGKVVLHKKIWTRKVVALAFLNGKIYARFKISRTRNAKG